jgi:hypothetical protein
MHQNKSENPIHILARRVTVLATTALAFATVSAASGWKDIQFGGFASQGYLVNTGGNDYLGETSEGTFDFREYAVNASYATGAWRVGAQAFGQKLGAYGEDEIKLDWATIDYQPAQWFGLRAGKVKMPRGLYNEALDLDSIRPFVLMPQSIYDARLRDFNAAFNGGMAFGNIGLGRSGSVDYRLYYGDIPMKTDSGASDYFNNDVPYPNLSIGMDSVLGGTVFWNTPVNGLRAGYSYGAFKDFAALRHVTFGTFVLDLYKWAPTFHRHLISVEYTRGDWIFAAEGGIEKATYVVFAPGAPPTTWLDFKSHHAYASVTRRLNDKFEFGAYVSYSRDTSVLRPTASIEIPTLQQVDYALSARYNISDRWLVKAEIHHMDGSGKLFDTPSQPQPIAGRDDSWQLLALKTTYSF